MIQGIKTKNIKQRIRERIREFTDKLKGYPEVEGIVYLGGLANTDYKDFIDELSDIDIGIFINSDKNHLPTWLQPFSFYIPIKNELGKESLMEVNLHQQLLNEEKNTEWPDSKREAYAYASEIIFDRHGEISKLIKEKTNFTYQHRKEYLAHLLSRINWSVKINPINAVERGFEFNAEELLNQGMEYMIDLVFVYNYRYPPHPKWKLAMLDKLTYCPNNFKDRLFECIKVEQISKDDIIRRREAILSIVTDIEHKLIEEGVFHKGEDYSDYEYIYWKPAKQIKENSVYDDIVALFPNLSDIDKKKLKGLLCEYFIEKIEDIYIIPKDKLGKTYHEILDKVIYQDPQSRNLINAFIEASKENNPTLREYIIRELTKRKITIFTKEDGSLDIKKIDYEYGQDREENR